MSQRHSTAALLAGFVLLSLNTRVPFGQIGPLAPTAGFDSAFVTVLGMLPPLGMGLAAPFVPFLLRRTGEDRLLLWASIAALVGAVIRGLGPLGLVIGTCVVALAIGVINVLIPVYVRRRFPGRRSGPVFGAYALAMGLGSALAAAVALPVAHATGRWELAIATAVIPAVLAVVGGVLMLDGRSDRREVASEPTDEPLEDEPVAEQLANEVKVARSWLGWSLLCFFGVQTLLFYGLLAWLPSILVAGAAGPGSAATGQTILILGIAFGGFAAPLLAARRPSQTGVIAVVLGLCVVGMLGLAYAEGLALWLWVPLLGLGLGGGQALPAVLYAHRGQTQEHTAALSAFAQTGGFLVASLGPLLMSTAHRASGTWTAPLVGLSIICAANFSLSWRGSRDPKSPRASSPVEDATSTGVESR